MKEEATNSQPGGFYRIAIAYSSGSSSMVYMTGRFDVPAVISKLIEEAPQILRLTDLDGCVWFITRAEIVSLVISHYPNHAPSTAQHAHVITLKRDEQRAEAACRAEGIHFSSFAEPVQSHDEGELPGEGIVSTKDRPH